MKQWLINLILLVLAIGIGIGLFLMKQRVVEYEKELNSLTNEILADMKEIHTLKADWAVLTEPSRLRHLISESSVKRIDVKQVISPDDVELTPVPVPPVKPFSEEVLPIRESSEVPNDFS
ncbi:MAG: hypothetical protein II938_02720 [Alphaproteobacteria bacterium]|nr:hypothetical protein [Alphaproteobacteria bacterium]